MDLGRKTVIDRGELSIGSTVNIAISRDCIDIFMCSICELVAKLSVD